MKKSTLFILLLGLVLCIPGCGFEGAGEAVVTIVEATPTPEPTPTPEATPTPAVPAATPTPAPVMEQSPSGVNVEKKDGTYYAAADLNLRADCTAEAELVDSVSAGAQLTSTGVCENGWIRVDYNGQTCYASGDFVTTTPPEGIADDGSSETE